MLPTVKQKEKIKTWLRKKGLTCKGFAESVGLNQSEFSAYICGLRLPSKNKLDTLMDALPVNKKEWKKGNLILKKGV
jgi:transcriptional regulator with XRE-family HTH domain